MANERKTVKPSINPNAGREYITGDNVIFSHKGGGFYPGIIKRVLFDHYEIFAFDGKTTPGGLPLGFTTTQSKRNCILVNK